MLPKIPFSIFAFIFFSHPIYAQVSVTIQTLLTDSTFPSIPPTTDDPFAFYPPIAKSDEYWTCNDDHTYPLLGGKNNAYSSITQNISNLPPYYSLTVSFSLYQLNTWALGSWTAKINGIQYFSYTALPLVYTICGVLSSHNSTQSFTVGSFIGSDFLVNYTTPYGLLIAGNSRFAMRNFLTTLLLCNSRCSKCTSYTIASCTKCIDNANITSNCICNSSYYNVSCGGLNKPPICQDQCLPCDPSCLTCVNGSTKGCTSCFDGYTLLSGSCIPNCAGGASLTNYIETDGSCAPCITPCYSCLNSTFCYSCTTSSLLYLVASKGQCLLSCPSGTYATTSMSCQNCDASCLTCSWSATICLSCVEGLNLFSNGSCLSCASGEYYNSSLNSCKKCDASCLTCNGSTSKNCLSCNSTALLELKSDRSCGCENGAYHAVSGSCYPCDTSCLTCSGAGSSSCLSCQSARYLSDGECLCYDGTYALTDGSGGCAPCDVSCYTCSLSPTNCTSCQLSNSQCMSSTCPTGSYVSSSGDCAPCSPYCQTCTGSESYNCLSCFPGMQVFGGYGDCQCNDGTYLVPISPVLTCAPCNSDCATCNGMADICTSCANELVLNSANSTCSACSNGTYFSSGVCLSCYPKCNTCLGPLESDCITCKQEMNFTNAACVCASGYFWNQTSAIFSLCDLNCLTCFGSDTNCTSCSSDKTLDPVTNTCMCGNATFYDNKSGKCLTCDSSCLTCDGTELSNCLTCKDPTKNLAFGQCISTCPDGYFADSNHVCQMCQKNCKKCQSSTICNICSDGYVLNSQESCTMQKKVYANMTAITNPTSFIVRFSEHWNYLMDNVQNLMILSINGLANNNFSYSLTNNNNTNSTLILINYKHDLNDTSLILNVTITIDYSTILSEFILVNKQFQSPLLSHTNCPQNYYYDASLKSCHVKNSIQSTLGLLENHLQISLTFSFSFKNFLSYLNAFSSVSIQGKVTKTDFNFSYIQNDDLNYIININTTRPIINRPKLTFCMDFPLEIVTQFNLIIVSNCKEINLLDWYPLSESDKKSIENTKKQTQVNGVVSANGMSTILASSSGIFLFGLMMIEMIYFLKYIDVNYPLNALSLFESKQSPYVLFFRYTFKMEPDSFVMPDIYTYYGVSPYFFNNTGEILSEISAVVVLAFFIMILNIFMQNKLWVFSKIFTLIGDLLIWELVILFIFLSIQKLFFYATCALCFFPVTSQGILNSVCALIIAFILIGWIACLFHHTKQCQNYRVQLEFQSELHAKNVKDGQSELLTPEVFTRDSPKFSPNQLISNYKQAKFKKIDILNLDSSKNKVTPFTFNAEEINTSKSIEDVTINNSHLNPITYRVQNLPMDSTTIATKPQKNNGFSKMKQSLTNFIKKLPRKHFNCFLKIFEVKNWVDYLQRYETLYEDLKQKTFWQRYYKLFYYCKQILISILVPALHKYPLFQMNLISIIYFGFLIATIVKNPFDSKVIWIINIISECICFSSISSVLALAFLDFNENQDYQLKMDLGWVIIYANIALLYWVMVSGTIKVFWHIYFKYKQYKFSRKVTNIG